MAVTYFNVTGNYSAFAPGLVLRGNVLFTPVFHVGDLAKDTSMVPPTGFVPVSVPAKIVNGVLVAADGNSTVQLQSNTADLGLTSPLYYAVTFENLTATQYHPTLSGITVQEEVFELAGFAFPAPADSTAVNLVSVAPAPGATTAQGAVTVTPAGIIGSTAFTQLFLTSVTDQASALAYLGAGTGSGSGAEWEEYANLAAFPATGDVTKEYVAKDTGKIYRWTGTAYFTTALTKADVGLSLADNTPDNAKNVLSATKLTTPRNINGVAFDGTQDITIAGSAPTNITGNAGTATKLQTARTINGVSFDGTANITVPAGTSDRVSVKDYGAVGDGTTDDTTNIGTAYTAAHAAGKPLYFPAGTYLVTALPALVTNDRVEGAGKWLTTIKYAGTSTLATFTSQQNVEFSNLNIWLTGAGATALRLSGCFRCAFTNVAIRGQHTGAATTYQGQIGLLLDTNSGGNTFNDCDFANLGFGVKTSCIENHFTQSRFSTCWKSLYLVGGTANAGVYMTNCEFVGGTNDQTTYVHVWCDGSANSSSFVNVWFEGCKYAAILGDSAGNGPSQFNMTGCKVGARTTGLVINSVRQTNLINVEFDSDTNSDASPLEVAIDGTHSPEGLALNLVTTLRGDFADADFPQYWTISRKGSFRAGNLSASNITVGGSITGNVTGTATKLATARTINGVPFDGSANITVPGATPATYTGVFPFEPCNAISSFTSGQQLNIRRRFEIPVHATRFRVHFFNYDQLHDVWGTGNTTNFTAYIGDCGTDATGDPNGTFASTPVQIQTSTTINAGTELITPWISQSTFDITANRHCLLSYGFSAPTTGQISAGGGLQWYTFANTDAGLTNPAGINRGDNSGFMGCYVEFEHADPDEVPVIMVVSNSFSGGGNTAGLMNRGELDSWHQQWALSRKGIAANISCGGSWANMYGTSSPKWNYYSNLATPLQVDAVIFMDLTSSDVAGGTGSAGDIATAEASIVAATQKAKALWPKARLIHTTIAPRGEFSAGVLEAARLTVNQFLATCPGGAHQCLELDAPLATTISVVDNADGTTSIAQVDANNPARLRAMFDSGDHIHMAPRGHMAVQQMIQVKKVL